MLTKLLFSPPFPLFSWHRGWLGLESRAVYQAGDTTDFSMLSVGVQCGYCGKNQAENEPLIVDHSHHCQGEDHSHHTPKGVSLKLHFPGRPFFDY